MAEDSGRMPILRSAGSAQAGFCRGGDGRIGFRGAEIGRFEAERGGGAVLMIILMMAAGFLITVTLALAGAIIARHRAGAIADLAALAAAGGPPGPEVCEQARRVAAANGGRLRRCVVLTDGSVLVEVGLANGGPSLLRVATGSARAGEAPLSDST